MISKR